MPSALNPYGPLWHSSVQLLFSIRGQQHAQGTLLVGDSDLRLFTHTHASLTRRPPLPQISVSATWDSSEWPVAISQWQCGRSFFFFPFWAHASDVKTKSPRSSPEAPVSKILGLDWRYLGTLVINCHMALFSLTATAPSCHYQFSQSYFWDLEMLSECRQTGNSLQMQWWINAPFLSPSVFASFTFQQMAQRFWKGQALRV